MVGPVRTDCFYRYLRCRTYSSIVYSRRPYRRYILDYLPNGLTALATLDRRAPSVAA